VSSLIYTMHVSADGYMADRFGGMWPGFGWPPEVHAALTELYREAGAVVYGRGTYETVVPFWTKVAEGQPTEMELADIHHEFAAVLRPIPKYVVSTTIDDPVQGVQVIRENAAAHVAETVASAGGDVLLLAGPRLTGELIAHGLVDEMLFIVGPVLLGAEKS
jgi:dihydrofolate reductase